MQSQPNQLFKPSHIVSNPTWAKMSHAPTSADDMLFGNNGHRGIVSGWFSAWQRACAARTLQQPTAVAPVLFLQGPFGSGKTCLVRCECARISAKVLHLQDAEGQTAAGLDKAVADFEKAHGNEVFMRKLSGLPGAVPLTPLVAVFDGYGGNDASFGSAWLERYCLAETRLAVALVIVGEPRYPMERLQKDVVEAIKPRSHFRRPAPLIQPKNKTGTKASQVGKPSVVWVPLDNPDEGTAKDYLQAKLGRDIGTHDILASVATSIAETGDVRSGLLHLEWHCIRGAVPIPIAQDRQAARTEEEDARRLIRMAPDGFSVLSHLVMRGTSAQDAALAVDAGFYRDIQGLFAAALADIWPSQVALPQDKIPVATKTGRSGARGVRASSQTKAVVVVEPNAEEQRKASDLMAQRALSGLASALDDMSVSELLAQHIQTHQGDMWQLREAAEYLGLQSPLTRFQAAARHQRKPGLPVRHWANYLPRKDKRGVCWSDPRLDAWRYQLAAATDGYVYSARAMHVDLVPHLDAMLRQAYGELGSRVGWTNQASPPLTVMTTSVAMATSLQRQLAGHAYANRTTLRKDMLEELQRDPEPAALQTETETEPEPEQTTSRAEMDLAHAFGTVGRIVAGCRLGPNILSWMDHRAKMFGHDDAVFSVSPRVGSLQHQKQDGQWTKRLQRWSEGKEVWDAETGRRDEKRTLLAQLTPVPTKLPAKAVSRQDMPAALKDALGLPQEPLPKPRAKRTSKPAVPIPAALSGQSGQMDTTRFPSPEAGKKRAREEWDVLDLDDTARTKRPKILLPWPTCPSKDIRSYYSKL